jgi:hypothetical protein
MAGHSLDGHSSPRKGWLVAELQPDGTMDSLSLTGKSLVAVVFIQTLVLPAGNVPFLGMSAIEKEGPTPEARRPPKLLRLRFLTFWMST